MKTRIKKKPIIGLIYIILFISLGLLSSGAIKKSYNKKAQELKKCILIYDSERMIDLRNGEFMAEGKIIAANPQRLSELPGQYLEIRRVEEEYRSHTSTHTTIDDDGIPHVSVETSSSWDEVRKNIFITPSITFLGRNFRISEIDFNHYPKYTATVRTGSKSRIVYYTYPISTESGVLIGKIKDGVGKDLVFKEGKTIKDIIHQKETASTRARVIFWIIYTLVWAGFFILIMDSIEN